MALENKNIRLAAYLQTYKYFEKYWHEIIKHEFKLKRKWEMECRDRYNALVDIAVRERKNYHRNRAVVNKNALNTTKCIIVGIHIRRGDFEARHNILYGHMPAQIDYLINALEYYRKQFVSNHKYPIQLFQFRLSIMSSFPGSWYRYSLESVRIVGLSRHSNR